MQELMTVKEVAEYFKVSVQTVKNWLNKRRLTPLKHEGARTVRIAKTEVENFMKEAKE